MQSQMINFSIPKPMLKALDSQAKADMKTRSEVLRDAVRVYLSQKQRWNDLFAYGRKRAKELGHKPEDVERLIDEYRQGK